MPNSRRQWLSSPATDLRQRLRGWKRQDVRELIISPYRLIYRQDANTVTITMVTHERRELTAEDVV